MYRLKPPKVFINTRVYKDKACVARLNRMMEKIECDSIREFSDDELGRIYEEEGWDKAKGECVFIVKFFDKID